MGKIDSPYARHRDHHGLLGSIVVVRSVLHRAGDRIMKIDFPETKAGRWIRRLALPGFLVQVILTVSILMLLTFTVIDISKKSSDETLRQSQQNEMLIKEIRVQQHENRRQIHLNRKLLHVIKDTNDQMVCMIRLGRDGLNPDEIELCREGR